MTNRTINPAEHQEDLPLYAQIAIVLGWTRVGMGQGVYMGTPPGREGFSIDLPQYGISWEDTGHLLERFQILLGPEYTKDGRHVFADQWSAKLGEDRTGDTITYGKTACEAVGNLLLKVLGEKK